MTTLTKTKNTDRQGNIFSLLLDKDQPYYHIWRTGLLAGIILLYVGVIGMLAAFNEREIIREGLLFNIEALRIPSLTLAQIVLVLPAFIAGFFVVRKLRDRLTTLPVLGAAVIVALLSATPTILLMLLAAQVDVRDMFVNVNRDWMEIVSFGNRDPEVLWRGILILLTVLGISGLVGGILQILPDKVRNSIIFGLVFTLLIGTMGVTVRLILQEIFPRDVLDIFFRRDTPYLSTAIGLFILATAFVWLPEKGRRAILFGLLVALAFEGLRSAFEVMTDSPVPFAESRWSMLLYLGLPFIAGLIGRLYYEYKVNIAPAKNIATTGNVGIGRNVARMDIIVLVIILMVAPWLVGRALSDVMVTIGIFVLMGIGLNIAIGLAGLLDLGYVTNYAVGAYVLAVLTSMGPLGLVREGYINFWVVLPIALFAAMFAGFVFAVPVLKMRGDYLAIATLGFGEIIGRLAKSDALSGVIGGAQGMSFIPKPLLYGFTPTSIGGFLLAIILTAAVVGGIYFALRRALANFAWGRTATFIGSVIVGTLVGLLSLSTNISIRPLVEFKDPETLYYIILGACIVTLIVSIRLNNSRIGRQWMAIREDEDVAAAMGIDVAQSKLLAFTISAATGGVAGAIFAAKVGTVFPNSFEVFVSINVLSLIIVGGMGSNPGIVLGAIVLMGLPELLREFTDFRWLMYGILLIWMMLNRPEGLWPSEVTHREAEEPGTISTGTD